MQLNGAKKAIEHPTLCWHSMSFYCGNYGVGTNSPFAFTYASDDTPIQTYYADAEEKGTAIRLYRDSDPALD